MSEKTTPNDGGPAFPCQPYDAQGCPMGTMDYGLSIRDWFAGHATDKDISEHQLDDEGFVKPGITREVARWMFADAMLAAREGGGK